MQQRHRVNVTIRLAGTRNCDGVTEGPASIAFQGYRPFKNKPLLRSSDIVRYSWELQRLSGTVVTGALLRQHRHLYRV